MLTESQKVLLQRLGNGEIADSKELKRARFGLRSYVRRMLKDIPELLEVMDVLGNEQMDQLVGKGEIGTDHLRAACQLSEKIAQILGVFPVARSNEEPMDDAVFKTAIIAVGRSLDLMTMYRTAAKEDLARWEAMKEHVANIEHHIDPYVLEPVVYDIEYKNKFMEEGRGTSITRASGWHLYGRRKPNGQVDPVLFENPPNFSISDFGRYVNPLWLPPRPRSKKPPESEE